MAGEDREMDLKGDKIQWERTSSEVADMVVDITTFGMDVAKSQLIGSKAKDPFGNLYAEGEDEVLMPAYDPLTLCRMVEVSDILGVCIRAMAHNIHSFGHEFVLGEWAKDLGDDNPDVKAEKAMLENLFMYANEDQDFTAIREELGIDEESTGRAFLEVIRDKDDKPAAFYWLPAWSMRMTKPAKESVPFEQVQRNSEGEFVTVSRSKKFRRFVQVINGRNAVWFKELGDPRSINSETGHEEENGNATEVVMFKITCSYDVYGLPRWIGLLMDMIGSRMSTEVNYYFFENNMIPPVVIMVSGGAMTKQTIQRLEDVFRYTRGTTRSFHKPILLEAAPHSASAITGEKLTPVKIDIKPLTQAIQKDSMFREYRKDNRNGVRSSFPLPPIYTGDTVDYTKATALVSAITAEEQVFGPARRKFDYRINRTILTALGVKYHLYKSLGAKTSDDVELLKALSGVKEPIPIGIISQAVADAMNIPMWEIEKEMADTPVGLMSDKFGTKPEPPPGFEDEEDEDDSDMDPEEKKKLDEDRKEKTLARLMSLKEYFQKAVDEKINIPEGRMVSDG